MACKDAKKKQAKAFSMMAESVQQVKSEAEAQATERLLFGADTHFSADDILQNNLTEFEWIARNKLYPNFLGRNIAGENCLTKEEIEFIHGKGCKIAAIYGDDSEKLTEEQGKILARKIDIIALELGIYAGTAIFLEIKENETVTREFMLGFATDLIKAGFTPGFKANTDAAFDFDREFSRGMQTDKEVFSQCIIWAVAPSLKEYDRVTTTHLIHPDLWTPFAPSGITRKDIAIWQYGKNCHPINDDAGIETTFNVDLVKDENIILEKMF